MNTHEDTPHDRGTDDAEARRWWVFRYVAGEMSAPEAAEFEACLADDESLCEAVARTVQLLDAVALAEGQASRPTRPVQPVPRTAGARPWRRAAVGAGMLASAAALAALFFLPGGVERDRQIVRERPVANDPLTDETDANSSHGAAPASDLPERLPERLLAAWNDSAVILGEDVADPAATLADGLSLSGADELELADGTGSDGPGTAAFGWLLAAVSDDAATDAPDDHDKTWDN